MASTTTPPCFQIKSQSPTKKEIHKFGFCTASSNQDQVRCGVQFQLCHTSHFAGYGIMMKPVLCKRQLPGFKLFSSLDFEEKGMWPHQNSSPQRSTEQLAAATATATVAYPDIIRPLANFAPTVLRDHFLSLPINNQVNETYITEEIERLIEEVRDVLVDTAVKRSTKIETISCLHRLGVSYHFENEIYSQLQALFANLCSEDDQDYDLYTISTQFRVFRQHGYKMSCDVFNNFKDASGKFIDTLTNDVRGLLSLYEACHLRVKGEDILDEALAFSTANLKRIVSESQISPSLAKQVAQALKQPFHWGIPRLEARAYISIYENEHESRNESILKLAKLDFNMLQKMHQQELLLLLKWWDDSEFSTKLPYVRERVIEAYFYANTSCPQPGSSLARIILTKVTMFSTILDDTYDAFSTFEELTLFTDAINKWDINLIDHLPNNMKFIYTKLLALFKELHDETFGDAQNYGVRYSIECIKEACGSYYEQAKWVNEGYIPNMDDEYTQVAYVSIPTDVVLTPFCVGMGDIVNKDDYEWLREIPEALKASRVIARLQNDLSGRKYEQERGHSASAVECYMKQYGVPFEDAVEELQKRIEDAMKDFTDECLKPTSRVPIHIGNWVTNMLRFTTAIYKEIDGYTQPQTIKDAIFSVLVDPVPT